MRYFVRFVGTSRKQDGGAVPKRKGRPRRHGLPGTSVAMRPEHVRGRFRTGSIHCRIYNERQQQ